MFTSRKSKNSFGDKHKSLSHGVEKDISQMNNEKHIVYFSDFCKDTYFSTKIYAKLS